MLTEKRTIEESVRNFILREIKNITGLPDGFGHNPESRIHEYRKALKRSRSLLRLIRYCMSEFSYEQIYGLLSSASKEIEDQRDSTVLLQTFTGLMKKHSNILSAAYTDAIRNYLENRVSSAYTDCNANILKNNDSAFSLYLKIAYSLLHTIHLDSCNASDLQIAIEHSYYSAANLFYDSKKTLDTGVMHKWRKSCKHLLLQLKFAPEIGTDCFQDLISFIDHITDMSGTDHDLAMLESAVRDHVQQEKEDFQQLHLMIVKERAIVKKMIFRTGDTLFKEERVRSFRFVSCN